MKKQIFSILSLAAILAIGCSPTEKKSDNKVVVADSVKTYTNPLGLRIGDPQVMKAPDGTYYMSGTGGGPDSVAYRGYKSKDLVNWTDIGFLLYRDPKTSWCTRGFCAPEMFFVNGKYYMFYTADWRDNPNHELENGKVGIAVSDKPEGPYRDIVNRPTFDPGYSMIDANFLADTDGRFYLYYSRCCYKHPVESEIADWVKSTGMYTEIQESWIYGVELKPDFTGVIGEPVVLVRPAVSFSDTKDSWESRSITNYESNRRWTEAPNCFKHGDTYYMMYSANSVGGNNYAIGYATSKSPLGPFVKADNNPVQETSGDVLSPAHNCMVMSPDGTEMYSVYGARSMKAMTKAALNKEVEPNRSGPNGFMGQGTPVNAAPRTVNGFMGEGAPAVRPRGARILYMDKMTILPDGKLIIDCGNLNPQPYPSNKQL